MTKTLPRLGLLLLMLFAGSFLAARPAHAIVVCSETAASINFGGVNVSTAASNYGTGTIGFTCTNYNLSAVNFSICAGIGTPSYPGTVAQPAMSGPSSLNFNLYTNAPNGVVWTTATPLQAAVSLPAGIGTSASGSMTFYGVIPGNQTATAGSYTASFYNTVLGFISGTTCGTLTGYSGLDFTLPVQATVTNQCIVSATTNLNFGSVDPTATNVTGSSSVYVTCPSGTNYYVGLMPSNASTTGAGVMTSASSTDKVPYQLRSVSATGSVWGNTATSTNVGNGVSGRGTGAQQTLSVFASAPSANYTPGSYSDTVTVNLNY